MAIGTFLGNYSIDRELGRGGMGAVYVGTHRLLGRPAAIKVLQPQYSKDQSVVQRFFNEARAATAIRHPSIVEIFDFGYDEDGNAYIVMELCDGESLAHRLRRMRVLPVANAVSIARQIAGALAAAHKANIVHRDLKPDNIFLVPDPEVVGGERIKLLDFGIAKLVSDTPGLAQTHTGMIMGTPFYMSPEQCRGAGQVDHRADIYSLGCILFEMVCGRVPFIGEGAGDIIGAHLLVPPPQPRAFLSSIDPDVEAFILELLAKKPADRPQRADLVVNALAKLAGTTVPTNLGLATTAVGSAPGNEPLPSLPPVDPALGETVASNPQLEKVATPDTLRDTTPANTAEAPIAAAVSASPRRITARMPVEMQPRPRRSPIIPVALVGAGIALGIVGWLLRAEESPGMTPDDAAPNLSAASTSGPVETRLKILPPLKVGEAPRIGATVINGPLLPVERFHLLEHRGTQPKIKLTASAFRKFAEGDDTVAFAFVVDGRELWMGNESTVGDNDPTRIRGAVRALATAFDRADLKDHFPVGSKGMLITYSDRVEVKVPMGPLGQITGETIGTERDYFGRSGRQQVAAITQAIAELRRVAATRKVLVVIGDGSDDDRESMGRYSELKKRAKAEDLGTFALVLKDKTSPPGTPIAVMVPATLTVNSAEGLIEALQSIVGRIADRYYLTFPGYDPATESGFSWDGKLHDVSILLDKEELDSASIMLPAWRPPLTAWERRRWLVLAGGGLVLLLLGVVLFVRARATATASGTA